MCHPLFRLVFMAFFSLFIRRNANLVSANDKKKRFIFYIIRIYCGVFRTISSIVNLDSHFYDRVFRRKRKMSWSDLYVHLPCSRGASCGIPGRPGLDENPFSRLPDL